MALLVWFGRLTVPVVKKCSLKELFSAAEISTGISCFRKYDSLEIDRYVVKHSLQRNGLHRDKIQAAKYFKSNSIQGPKKAKLWINKLSLRLPKHLVVGQPLPNSHDPYEKNGIFNNHGSSAKSKLRATRQKFQETRRNVKEQMEILKENILTVPNGLCVLRIALTPVLGYLVINGNYSESVIIFTFAGFTDLLDGFIARNFPNQQSMIGSFLDPAADKFLVATLFVTLTFVGLIPIPLTALIITRDIFLMGAASYIRYKSLPSPRTISRYFDVTFPTVKISPTLASKINTAVQLSLAAFTLAGPVFDYVDHPYLKMLWYLTAFTTVTSGLSYLFTKNTYKFISYKRLKT